MITFKTIHELRAARALVGDVVKTLDQDVAGDNLGAIYEVRAGGVGITMTNGVVAVAIAMNKSIYPAANITEALNNLSAQAGHVANVKDGANDGMWDYVPAGSVTVNGTTIRSCIGVPSLALVERNTHIGAASVIHTDGSKQMDTAYKPTHPQDVVTQASLDLDLAKKVSLKAGSQLITDAQLATIATNAKNLKALKGIKAYKGRYASTAARDLALPAPDEGDYVLIGLSTAAEQDEYIYEGGVWVKAGKSSSSLTLTYATNAQIDAGVDKTTVINPEGLEHAIGNMVPDKPAGDGLYELKLVGGVATWVPIGHGGTSRTSKYFVATDHQTDFDMGEPIDPTTVEVFSEGIEIYLPYYTWNGNVLTLNPQARNTHIKIIN